MEQDHIVIVAAKRTATGAFQGELASLTAPELAAAVIKDTLAEAGLAPEQVDEVILGCVLTAGLKQAPARQAAIAADLPYSTAASSVNKVCGSGMKSVMLAHDLIKAGSVNTVIAGGMESMSNAPYMLPNARSGMRLMHGQVLDHMMFDGLEDAYQNQAMGCLAQQTADQYQLSRNQMDEFAIASLTKAQAAIQTNAFTDEITPLTIKHRKGEYRVDTDEQPSKAKLDKIPQLKPAFAKTGSLTAANSSSISDGAASLLVMKASDAAVRGLTPLARIVGHSTASIEPEHFTLAPVAAINSLLMKTGWHKEQVDLWEINEAFAMVTLLACQQLELDQNKVNVNGGACALGHPIGASGARVIVTLLHALKKRGLKTGIASLCIGGGEAVAMAFESC